MGFMRLGRTRIGLRRVYLDGRLESSGSRLVQESTVLIKGIKISIVLL